MIAWQGPGDRRFTRGAGDDPSADPVRASWLPEDRQEYAELLAYARDALTGSQRSLDRATQAYQAAFERGGEPLELLVLRVNRALNADAVLFWSLEVDALVDLMHALDMNPPTNGAQP